MARQGTECLNTPPSKHSVFSGCLGILALRCVFNKKLHRPEFISFPLLMSTREMLPEEGLLDKIVSHWYAQHMKLLQVTEEYGNKGLALSSFSFFVCSY